MEEANNKPASSAIEPEENLNILNEPPRNPAAESLSLEDYVKSYQDNIKAFKEMLQEKEVMPFSTYDKFLPKMIRDQRFLIIPYKLRRPLFEDLIRNYTVEFQKTKQAEKKAVQEGLVGLLNDYQKAGGFVEKPSYQEFKKFFENDKRLVESMRCFEVEKYFNVKLEKVQKDIKDEQAKAKFQFSEMVKEYILNRSNKVDKNTKWKHAKKELKKDKRYELVASSKDRERLFEGILHDTLPLLKERDRSRSRENRRERRPDSIKVFKDDEDSSARVDRYKKFEAMNAYEILLAEKIKTYDIRERDAEKILEKDPRYGQIDLRDREKNEIFHKYIEHKRQDTINIFKQILDEKKYDMEPDASFEDALPLFQDDKRYALTKKDARYTFEEFMEKVRDDTHVNFEKFLNETPLLNKDSPLEGEEFANLLERLEKDFRCERMRYRSERREKMIKKKIQALKEEFIKKHGRTSEGDDIVEE